MLLALCFILFCGSLMGADEPILILNMPNEEILPHQFRACWDPYKLTSPTPPPRKGLENLNASGSGQFSQKSLQAIIRQIVPSGSFYVLDLRQESHGFLNGAAVSWYTQHDWINRGKSDAEIAKQETQLLADLRKLPQVKLTIVEKKDEEGRIANAQTEVVPVQSVLSEKEVTEAAQVGYFRIYTPDHVAPLPEEVDRFINFIVPLPANAWVHVHCAAGDGRTTTFLSLIDMLHNAKKVSFDDIIQRQYLLGGIDLSHVGHKDDWKQPYIQARYEFLKKFYDYAKGNTDGFKTLWSQYQK